MKDKCDFTAFSAQQLEDNILLIDFKKVKELTVEDMREVNRCYNKMNQEALVYVIVTFQGFLPMKNDVMAEVKKQRDKIKDVFTVCVIRNVGIRMSLKFFLSFYRSKHPIHITAKKKEALALIKKHQSAARKVART